MVIIDNEPAKSFVAANEGIHILEGDNEYAIEDYAICVAKENTELLEKINQALKELKEDGTIDRTAVSTANGAIILKAAKERGVADEAFEFVKWWADAKTQEKYAYAMESIQGIAGRPALANMAAFENVGWTDEEKAIISEQRSWSKGIEQIPGNYIILRHLTNALRTSFNDYADPLRQLNIQCRFINQELIRKRAEFVDNN
jgi:hypothetical protein